VVFSLQAYGFAGRAGIIVRANSRNVMSTVCNSGRKSARIKNMSRRRMAQGELRRKASVRR
jgi:hypothetical protein